ncbi:murein transglycosylase [Thalassobacter stenotrophicus]|uniref:lytic murein transglycosylase n=1 Tax=Thalassobacter TaxID=266808 RepID=UPI00051CDF3F|nr:MULTISPECIES: lytic murein transglycosylase [Thalassobacter]KGK78548.1 murein transglycosylase [Thalassobacter stenotrophicus]KGL00721.1 murein transglycosylase [Thalassobacter sp. 16PALIMAR09]
MRGAAAVIGFVLLCGGVEASPLAVDTSERPAPRVQVSTVTLSTLSPVPRPKAPTLQTPVIEVAANARFDRWVGAFKRRARGQGISQRTLDQAFEAAQYLPDVIRRDRNQAEFTKTLWEYLDSAVSATRVRNGKAALRKHARVLDRIEAQYGVPKEIVVAVWGLESAYGTFRGSEPTISALATLAFDGRRARFFESELVNALTILQNGDIAPQNMTGSWAGAMGHTQFMPSSYNAYAVDFTGDGRRDIWSDDPSDALASTANYLARFGWQKSMPWGVEVELPNGFDYGQTGDRIRKSANAWRQLGVRPARGGQLPNSDRVSILVPAGAKGVAFAIYQNFQVIERYNPADAYVIAVGHLADRIAGRPDFKASWPRGDRGLRFVERKEVQQLLARRGFDPGAVDGKIGPNTLSAVRRYQASIGATPDGYVSLDLLNQLRR